MMPIRFAQVITGVYRGGAPTSEQLRILHDKYFVKHILSLDSDISQEIDGAVKALKMTHDTVALGDEGILTDSLKYLARNIQSLFANRPMYVHCAQGKDRTGLAVALFRIANGMIPEQALREARSFGFGIGLSNQRLGVYTKLILTSGGTKPVSLDNNAADAVDSVRNLLGEPQSGIDVFDSRHQSSSFLSMIDFSPGAGIERFDNQQSFGPITPIPENLSDVPDPLSTENFEQNMDKAYVDDRKKRKSKIRRMILEDMNDAMAQTGVFQNTNPILRGIGPIEPGGIMPYGWSFAY